VVRERVVQVIRYGHFREALEILTELDRLCVEKGLGRSTFWSPLSGPDNVLIVESEYSTLADFERESEAFYADPDVMKLLRSAAQYFIDGSGRTELIATAPSLA
jgi:hypothetical protein